MAATPKQIAAMGLYAGIMEEVKIRFQSIEAAVNGQTGLIPTIAQELCYLQLRMLCELIAFGCVLAHGEFTSLEKLHKEYAADKIVNELEKLLPHFYPQPVQQTKTGPTQHHLQAIQTGYLKKKELVDLYRHCGDSLHRGKLKKLLSPDRIVQVNFPRIIEAAYKMSLLLNQHILAMPEGGGVMICMLRNTNNQDRAQVVWGEPSIAKP